MRPVSLGAIICAAFANSWSAEPVGATPRVVHETGFPAHFEAVALPGKVNKAVDLLFLPDGSFFLTGKHGDVFFHSGSALQSTPVLDLSDEIVHTGDRGLLGLAAHPGFVADGGATSWIYLAYTVSPVPGTDPGFNEDDKHAFSRVVRYRTDTVVGDVVALDTSREVLLGNQLPDGTVPDGIATLWSSHAVGSLVFGSDGSLLVSTGDGAHADQFDAGGVDPAGFDPFIHPVTGLLGPMPADQDCGAFRAQDLRNLSGKVLRIDPATGSGYPSNPFFDGDVDSNASRVWALGLRNPYRMALVPGTGSSVPADGDPGQLLVGDVGWTAWEELDLCAGGENFGWPCFEGTLPHADYDTHAFLPNPFGFPDCGNLGPGVLTPPVVTWHHGDPLSMQPPGVHVDEAGVPQPGIVGSASIGGPRYPGGDYPAEYAGRYFFADFADEWIRTLVLDGQGAVVEVADFAFDIESLVDLEVHPITGDVHYVGLGAGNQEGRVYRVRYGANLTPTAVALAQPAFGDAPLVVDFDGSGSSDPEQDPLTYSWDFGDGSPTAIGALVQHTYTVEGLYSAVLTVTDDGGQADDAEILVAVGDVPPVAEVLAPLAGATFADFDTLLLSGTGTEFGGGPLTYEWTVDLYHNTHVHPELATLFGATAAYVIDPHGDPEELFYLRVELTVESEAGLRGSDHVFIYPAENLFDATGKGRLITRVDELVPPFPTGSGNIDPEVMRDGVFPPSTTTDRQKQFDTYHDGDQGDDDWIGLELAAAPSSEVRFTSLVFQEGIHFNDGGWFADWRVEVRDAGVWSEAQNLVAYPDYPFELAQTPGFDGVGFDVYELHFDPQYGDAIRLRGTPGGSLGYLSAGELRVRNAQPLVPDPWRDLTADGTPIFKVSELVPPFPQGQGSKDVETIRNQTWPPVGSDSLLAQLDTFHFGDQGSEDWVGYAFDEWQTFSRVVLQEGFHAPGGGWFEDLAVETRPDGSAAWSPAEGASVTPAAPGNTGPLGSYETFELLFDPVVAREVRVVGTPGGVDAYVSVGELRVYGPSFDEEVCGWTAYGAGIGGTNVLSLSSTTPAVLGHPAVVELGGAPGSGVGTLLLGFDSLSLPVLGGFLLVNPVGAGLLPIPLDASGAGQLIGKLPSNPALAGVSFYLQVLAANPLDPQTLLFSNGLEMALCD